MVVRTAGTTVPNQIGVKAEQFERLLWLLGLSEEERGFVRFTAVNPNEPVALSAFADWLSEHGRREEAKRFKVMAEEKIIESADEPAFVPELKVDQ